MRVSTGFLYFLVGALLVVLVVIIAYFDPEQVSSPQFTRFYQADLEGKISRMSSGRSFYFELGGKKDGYFFYPRTDEHFNEGKPFHFIAAVGDYVRKPAKSDTLSLKKNGKTYRYTFKKFKL